jgi:hypothetical protein
MSSARRAVRLWLVAALLLVAGLTSRLVLEFGTNFAYSYPYAVILQCGFYSGGLLALLADNLRQSGQSERATLGCLGLLIVAAVCAFLVISTPPK